LMAPVETRGGHPLMAPEDNLESPAAAGWWGAGRRPTPAAPPATVTGNDRGTLATVREGWEGAASRKPEARKPGPPARSMSSGVWGRESCCKVLSLIPGTPRRRRVFCWPQRPGRSPPGCGAAIARVAAAPRPLLQPPRRRGRHTVGGTLSDRQPTNDLEEENMLRRFIRPLAGATLTVAVLATGARGAVVPPPGYI